MHLLNEPGLDTDIATSRQHCYEPCRPPLREGRNGPMDALDPVSGCSGQDRLYDSGAYYPLLLPKTRVDLLLGSCRICKPAAC